MSTQMYREMFDRIPVEPMPLEEFMTKMAVGIEKRSSAFLAEQWMGIFEEIKGLKWDVQHSMLMKMERELSEVMTANRHNQLGMEHTLAWGKKLQVEQVRKFLEGKINTERL